MVGIICLITGLSLLYWTTLQPIYRGTVVRIKQQKRQALRQAKIKAIRNYYPGLKVLTPSEIAARYNIEQAYNRIAR